MDTAKPQTGVKKDTLEKRVRSHLLCSSDVKSAVANACMEEILSASEIIADSFRSGGKLLLCGNGGSAADCQHMAAEFVSRLTKGFKRPGLPAIALTTDSSFITAFANDEGYEDVFARQVQALGKEGDILIGISTSGTSTNVMRAFEQAKESGLKTILLSGKGGKGSSVDITIAVPHDKTQFIQEAHLAIEHIICDLVECHLFNTTSLSD